MEFRRKFPFSQKGLNQFATWRVHLRPKQLQTSFQTMISKLYTNKMTPMHTCLPQSWVWLALGPTFLYCSTRATTCIADLFLHRTPSLILSALWKPPTESPSIPTAGICRELRGSLRIDRSFSVECVPRWLATMPLYTIACC